MGTYLPIGTSPWRKDVTPDDDFVINGHRFWIRTLDLNQNFEQGENSIRNQLDRIEGLV